MHSSAVLVLGNMQKREDLKKAPFSLPTKHHVRASEMRGTNRRKASRNSQAQHRRHYAEIGKYVSDESLKAAEPLHRSNFLRVTRVDLKMYTS
jgi:hypothetical protein